MILALNKHSALHVFASADEAQRYLEAIDVQQDAFEFCDASGQRYAPVILRPPGERRLGPFAIVDIGLFKLAAQGNIDSSLPERFVERAAHIEHTSFPAITSMEVLPQICRETRLSELMPDVFEVRPE
jgi:hypothetical protein